MPIYEFKCPDCYRLEEKYFSFTEKHTMLCDNKNCKEAPMEKVMHAVPAILRGGGWGGQ